MNFSLLVLFIHDYLVSVSHQMNLLFLITHLVAVCIIIIEVFLVDKVLFSTRNLVFLLSFCRFLFLFYAFLYMTQVIVVSVC